MAEKTLNNKRRRGKGRAKDGRPGFAHSRRHGTTRRCGGTSSARLALRAAPNPSGFRQGKSIAITGGAPAKMALRFISASTRSAWRSTVYYLRSSPETGGRNEGGLRRGATSIDFYSKEYRTGSSRGDEGSCQHPRVPMVGGRRSRRRRITWTPEQVTLVQEICKVAPISDQAV